MKSRILAFAVVALLALMVWGLSSISRSIYGVPPFSQSHPVVEHEPVTEGEPVDETVQASDEEAAYFPFADLNAVYAMEVSDETVQFVGKSGTRVLDLTTSTWRFTQRGHEDEDIYASDYRRDLHTLEEKLPEWYGMIPTCWEHDFDRIWARCQDGGHEYLLVENTYDGIVGVEDVIDVTDGIVYRMPYSDSRFMAVHNGSVWLGGPHGIIRLDLSARVRWQYVCPPRFREVAGWTVQGKMSFITSREGDFMILDTETRAIELKTLPDELVAEVFERPDEGATPGPIWFSNPVLAKGKVFIAAHNWTHMAILSYDIVRKTWGHMDLPRDMAGHLELVQTADVIWCVGGDIWGDGEGNESGECGGVAAIVPGKESRVYPTLLRVPIGWYRLDGDTIQFQSAKAIEYPDSEYAYPGLSTDRSNQPEKLREADFCCTISLNSLQIVGYARQTPKEAMGLFIQVGQTRAVGGDPADVDWWLVKPAMVEMPDQHVDVLKAGEEYMDNW